jgi:glycerophosphoryl diester phosphodiesterase
MQILWIILSVLGGLALLALLYVLSTMCRKGHKGLENLRGWSYAHRGLHGNGIPENSMAAFRAALDGGYGIELDLHLMKDGKLAVFHDNTLDRTTGKSGRLEDLTAEDLVNYPLEGTDEQIPLFSQVLELYDGKAPMIVELKPVGGNHAALTKAACDMLDAYHGVYCLESFDPRCIHWLKNNRPELIRGQLTENFIANKKSPLPFWMKAILTHQVENFLVKPDFVAYKFADRKTLSNFLVHKLWGAQGVTWTLKTPQEYAEAVEEGWIPIFEGFRP